MTPLTVTTLPASGVAAPVPCTWAIVWVASAADAGDATTEPSPRAIAMAAAGAMRRGRGRDMTLWTPLVVRCNTRGLPHKGGRPHHTLDSTFYDVDRCAPKFTKRSPAGEWPFSRGTLRAR